MIEDIRWVSVAEMLSKAASVITVPILTNLLIPSQYGLYRSVFLIIAMVTVHGYFNISSIARKRLSQFESETNRGNFVTTLLVAVIGLLFCSYLGLLLLVQTQILDLISADLRSFISSNYILLFGLFMLVPLYSVCLGISSGLQEFRLYSLIKSVTELIILGGIGALAFTQTLIVEHVLWLILLAKGFSLVFLLWILRESIGNRLALTEFRTQLTSISIPLLPRNLIKKFETVVPGALILSTFGPVSYAAWTVVLTFDQLFLVLGRPLSQVLLPELSSRISDNRPISPIVRNFYLFMSTLVVPIISGGWILGPDLISLIFGSNYLIDKLLVKLVITGLGIKVLTTIATHFYIAHDRSDLESVAGVVGGLIFGVFMIFGVQNNSITFFGFGLAGSWTSRFIIGYLYQRKVINLGLPDGSRLFKILLSNISMISLVYVMSLNFSGLLLTLLLVLSGGFVYFLILLLTGFFNKGDVEILRRFSPL